MARLSRILAVTGGLVAAGAVFGAIAGAVSVAVAVALTYGIANAADANLLAFAALVGAVIGAAGAPVASWLLLRRVALGRAVAWTTFGAIVGGVLGWTLGSGYGVARLGSEMVRGVLGAVAGFTAAAILLRLRASESRDVR